MITPLKNALQTASVYKFCVIPVYGTDENGRCLCGDATCDRSRGKHPIGNEWQKRASNDRGEIEHLFSGLTDRHNYGIATGLKSGVFVVDIDGAEGEENLTALEKLHGALPKTLTATTGRGRHLFFKYPDRKVIGRSSKLAEKLDIRGEGNQVVGAGSVHFTGTKYQWHNPLEETLVAPEWLIDLVCREKTESAQKAHGLNIEHPRPSLNLRSGAWSQQDVADMLDRLSPDLGRDDWLNIGMALHEGGWPFDMWDSWSRRSTSKYNQRDIIRDWNSFDKSGGRTMGTLVKMARDAGWVKKNGLNVTQDGSAYDGDGVIVEDTPAQEPPAAEPVPEPRKPPVLAVRGIIQDTVDEILATSHLPQPELALLNTLTVLGAVFGRRYKTAYNNRSNLYTVGIVRSGAGKDHSRNFLRNLMIAAGLKTYRGPDSIISGAGVLESLSRQPSQIMHLDEFGKVLKSLNDTDAASHLRPVGRIITEMYSQAGSTYMGGVYADKSKEQVVIVNPNLCIYGTTTLETYTEALTKELVNSGELNRFVILHPDGRIPQRSQDPGPAVPSEGLVSRWSRYVPPMGQSDAKLEPSAVMVTWTGLKDRIYVMACNQDKLLEADKVTGALWARYTENCIKVAMIIAIARDPVSPNITHEDMDYAETLIKESVKSIVNIVRDNVAENDFEKNSQKILNILRKYGGSMKLADLSDKTRGMDLKRRELILNSLEEANQIEMTEKQNGGGRKSTLIKLK